MDFYPFFATSSLHLHSTSIIYSNILQITEVLHPYVVGQTDSILNICALNYNRVSIYIMWEFNGSKCCGNLKYVKPIKLRRETELDHLNLDSASSLRIQCLFNFSVCLICQKITMPCLKFNLNVNKLNILIIKFWYMTMHLLLIEVMGRRFYLSFLFNLIFTVNLYFCLCFSICNYTTPFTITWMLQQTINVGLVCVRDKGEYSVGSVGNRTKLQKLN